MMNAILHRRVNRSLYELAANEPVDPDLQRHAAECPRCRAAVDEMRATLGIIDAADFSTTLDRPGVYWQMFPDKVLRRLAQSPDAGTVVDRFGWFGSRSAFLAGAVTSLVVAGVALSLWWWTSRPLPETEAPATPAVNVHDRAYDYLERSRVVLIGVLNAEAADLGAAPGLLRQNGVASRHLVEEARSLNKELNQPGDERLRQLVNELEVILVQLANLGTEHGVQGLEIIRDGVDRKGVLLKITIEEMNRSSSRPQTGGESRDERTTDRRSL